jgi:uncharacterized phage-associated protein
MNKERVRLFHFINFFLENTRLCHKTKLFKLLYLLDKEHIKETGLPATGLKYNAWTMGPVPPELVEDISFDPSLNRSEDFKEFFEVSEKSYDDEKFGFDIKAKKPLDEKFFTKRQLRILRDLAQKYKDKTAKQMVDITHQENDPWFKAWNECEWSQIPLEWLSVEDGNFEDIDPAVKEKIDTHMKILNEK